MGRATGWTGTYWDIIPEVWEGKMKNCWALRRRNRKASHPAVPSLSDCSTRLWSECWSRLHWKKLSKKVALWKYPRCSDMVRTSPFPGFSIISSSNPGIFGAVARQLCFPTVPSSIITGLEQLAKVLDNVSWKYWKPGEQPAKILDWMQLRMQDGTCGNTWTVCELWQGVHVLSTLPEAPKKLDKSILSWCGHGVISRHKRTIKNHLFFAMGWNSRAPIGPLLLIPKAAGWLWTAATHIPWPGTWVIWRKPLISSCWTTGTSQPSWTWSIGGSWVLGCRRRQMPGVEEFQGFPKMGPKPSHQKWPITSDDFGVSCFKQLSNV